MLCDKVNVELEEFGNTLQSLLSQQFAQVSHLVSISNTNKEHLSQVRALQYYLAKASVNFL